MEEVGGMPKELYEAASCGGFEAAEKAGIIADDEEEYLVKKKTLVGNNIVHIAMRNRNIEFAREAVKRYPHLLWEANMDGNTPFHFAAMSDRTLQQQIDTKDFLKKVWDDDELFDDDDGRRRRPLLLRMQNSMGNTPLHVAVIHGNFIFAEALAKKDLHWVKNLDGNTPLHIAADLPESRYFVWRICTMLQTYDNPISPLSMQDSMGNAPLHVALIHARLDVANTLLREYPALASVVNVSGESPLHLIIKLFPHYNQQMDDRVKEDCIRVMEGKPAESDDDDVGSEVVSYVELVEVIVWLLEEASYVAGWRDKTGLTPLHKAASISKALNLNIIAFMIERCPQSMEVCDTSGKTIVHHLINRTQSLSDTIEFFNKTGVSCLTNLQDNEGNTLLHLAVIHEDFIMLQLLDDSNYIQARQVIKNKQGRTAKELFRTSNLKEEVEKRRNIMPKEICHAIEQADASALAKKIFAMGFYTQRDSEERNILHKLFYTMGKREISELNPEFFLVVGNIILFSRGDFLSQSDKNGETPMHYFARLKPVISMPFFSFFDDKDMPSILLPQNLKGNTPAHEAVIANNHVVLKFLVNYNEEATSLVNTKNETVLHLLATYPMLDISDDLLGPIIRNNTQGNLPLLDKDGQTPVTRAIQAGNIDFATKLVSSCPSLASMKDANGQTFWHLLVNELPIESLDLRKFSLTKEVALKQLEQKDKNGMTALHLALKNSRFDLAEAFLGLHEDNTSKGSAPTFLKKLLHIPNDQGMTPADRIGELAYVPPKFEKFMGKASTMIGIRSIWGIPSTELKEYVNTMGVIAALITTITFTAAFTVPGGLDQEKGNPLLIQDPSFQAFIVFDILAMCLSMMVLFCLLWIMAMGKKRNAVLLLDFSIILLLASFYTTLLTFMTGLYATTHLVKPWVGILGLVACSLLLLLMHKFLVRKFIIPLGKVVLIYFDKACMIVKKLAKNLCCCKRSSSRSELPISSIEMNNTNSIDDGPATI